MLYRQTLMSNWQLTSLGNMLDLLCSRLELCGLDESDLSNLGGHWDCNSIFSCGLNEVFTDSGLSSQNYTAFLLNLGGQELPGDVTLSVGAAYHSTAQTALDYLTNELGWSIKDGGPIAVCADGFVFDGEMCDDGNLIDGDGCDSNCKVTGCGNGVLTASEECDDGNTVTEACNHDAGEYGVRSELYFGDRCGSFLRRRRC